jgi:hypothetical protein
VPFELEQKGPEIRTGNMVNDQDVRVLSSHLVAYSGLVVNFMR